MASSDVTDDMDPAARKGTGRRQMLSEELERLMAKLEDSVTYEHEEKVQHTTKELNSEVEMLRQKVALQESEINKLQQTVDENEQSFRNQMENKDEKIKQLTQECEQLKSDDQIVRGNDNQVQAHDGQEIKENKPGQDNEVLRYKEELLTTQQKVNDLEKENTTLRGNLANSLQDEREQRVGGERDFREKLSRRDREIKRLRDECDELKSRDQIAKEYDGNEMDLIENMSKQEKEMLQYKDELLNSQQRINDLENENTKLREGTKEALPYEREQIIGDEQGLQEKMSTQEKEIQRLREECEALKTRDQIVKENDNQVREHNGPEIKENLTGQDNEMLTYKDELLTTQQKVNELEKENTILRENLASALQEEREERKGDGRGFREKLSRRDREIRRLRDECDELKARDQVVRDSDGHEMDLIKDVSKKDKEILRYKDELLKSQQKINDLENENTKLREEAKGALKEERKKRIGDEKELWEKLSSQDTEIQRLRDECEELKTRAQVAGENEIKIRQCEVQELMVNPSDQKSPNKSTKDKTNTMDHSETNRPLKLTERYNELYDNEWTDAFETIQEEIQLYHSSEDKLEQEAIFILLQVLKEVWRFCKDESRDEDTNIREAPRRGRDKQRSLPEEHTTLKSTKKDVAAHNMDKVFMKFLRRKPMISDFPISQIQTFVEGCTQLCLLMTNQDPPLVFEMTTNKYDDFDSRKYRKYTKRGTAVDFVVWPPMLQYENGPVLVKGVAQGLKLTTQKENSHAYSDHFVESQTYHESQRRQRKGYADYDDVYHISDMQTNLEGANQLGKAGAYRDIVTVNAELDKNTRCFVTKRSQSEPEGIYEQTTVKPVYKYPYYQRSRDKQDDAHAMRRCPSDLELAKFLEYLEKGYSLPMIKNKLGDAAFYRCKYYSQMP